MMQFDIDYQVIKRRDVAMIVANSVDYLEVEVQFTNDWSELAKTIIFDNNVDTPTEIVLDVNNRVTQDKHLNLTVGTWDVSVVGVYGSKRIITNKIPLIVYESGASSGAEPADPTPDVYAQIMTMLTDLNNLIQTTNIPLSIVGRDANGSTELTSLKLDLAPEIAPVQGEIYWNPTSFVPTVRTLDGVDLEYNSEEVQPVNNKTASTIQDGTVVAWTSTDGNSGNFNVVPYIANGTIEPERIVGIATHDIEAGTSGLITFWGKLRGISTNGSAVGETWTSGTVLYAHPTQAGKFTSVKPNYPNRVTRVGIVISAHATAGTMFIQRTNYPLAEQIGVKDLANYYTATDLEGILAEIGARL